MRLIPRCTLVALAASAPAAAQSPSPDVLSRASLASSSVQVLSVPERPGAPFALELELQGAVHRLELAPHSVRADDFQVLAVGGDGVPVPVEAAPPATYRGTVVGYPESVVAGSLRAGGFEGLVHLAPDLPLVGVQPLRELDPGAQPGEHLVYDALDVVSQGEVCGTEDLEALLDESGQVGGVHAMTGLAECEIAVDADHPFYLLNGSSVAGTQADVEAVLNGVDAIYAAQVDLVFTITTILVRTSPADPYTTSSPSGLLNQFANEWTTNQASVPRDIQHLFTGTNLDGSTIGIASLNSVCGLGSGHGLSQSRYTSNFNNRVALTAHEVGHNFSAFHCNGLGDCRIMCSGLGGCSGIVTSFGPDSVASILGKKEGSGCLGVPPSDDVPDLVSVDPASTPAYKAGPLTIGGTNFGGTTEVRIGNTVVPPSSVQIAFDSLEVAATTLTEAGSLEIQVTNNIGTSGGLFVDVQEVSAVQHEAPQISVPDVPFQIDWSGGADNVYFFVVAPNALSFPFGGTDLLASGNVVLSGLFGSSGAASFVNEAMGSFPLLVLYMQVWVLDGSTFAFEGASAVTSTIFL